MNERIQKLIQEATDTVEIVNPNNGITHQREFFDKEKFAELIVKECINVGLSSFLKDNSTVPVFPSEKIKEHFGVQ